MLGRINSPQGDYSLVMLRLLTDKRTGNGRQPSGQQRTHHSQRAGTR
jgi:hypothetical protein